ncbi:protein of unknown function (plasmid) [Azospirillum baldaniorum]|uniref:FecR N-terminal domain-containing protein n=1 Tax=Azospirillum baldaniorum TaxID=1064539 RepID=A0A9P1NQZ7_9PROT|nr:protein of unknown function [Azospirillum baldaniorum]
MPRRGRRAGHLSAAAQPDGPAGDRQPAFLPVPHGRQHRARPDACGDPPRAALRPGGTGARPSAGRAGRRGDAGAQAATGTAEPGAGRTAAALPRGVSASQIRWAEPCRHRRAPRHLAQHGGEACHEGPGPLPRPAGALMERDRDQPDLPDTPRDAALAWFVRMESGDADAADRRAFHAWLAQDPAHRREYDRLAGLWGDLDRVPDPRKERRAAPTRRRFLALGAVGGAAACAAALGGAVVLTRLAGRPEDRDRRAADGGAGRRLGPDPGRRQRGGRRLHRRRTARPFDRGAGAFRDRSRPGAPLRRHLRRRADRHRRRQLRGAPLPGLRGGGGGIRNGQPDHRDGAPPSRRRRAKPILWPRWSRPAAEPGRGGGERMAARPAGFPGTAARRGDCRSQPLPPRPHRAVGPPARRTALRRQRGHQPAGRRPERHSPHASLAHAAPRSRLGHHPFHLAGSYQIFSKPR